ncbi:MAG: asparagine synthase-related protein [Acidimicrobiia bacterium]
MLYRPTDLEISTGGLFGLLMETELAVLGDIDPRPAIESVVLEALQRPHCFVSFSGGVDSSILLAVATSVARRHGLDDPIPITKRFRAEGTDERSWQELVVRKLGLHDWLVLELDGELDLIGDRSLHALRRFGLAWPAPLWADIPVFEAARGGALLSGEGGDEILGWRRFTPIAFFMNGARPTPRRLSYLFKALAPASLRRRDARREAIGGYDWLRPEPRREAMAAWVEMATGEPLRPAHGLEWVWRHRGPQLALRNSRALAGEHGVDLFHPLFDERFVGALAGAQRLRDWRGRPSLAERYFGDLLPHDVLTRPTKARFDHVYFGAATRSFVREWDGTGVDATIVDVDSLRRVWQRPVIDGGTALLVQQARLAADVRVAP